MRTIAPLACIVLIASGLACSAPATKRDGMVRSIASVGVSADAVNDPADEQRKAERMRVRVLRQLARYHLSDEFLREREVLGALLLRQKLEQLAPGTRDEVRVLIADEESRIRELLERQWKPDLKEMLQRYHRKLNRLLSSKRNQSRFEPLNEESEALEP